MSISYFDSLPIEILYRIFDNLDIETIFLSIRYICKYFYNVTNSYNRYKFNFKSISKSNFYFICQFISCENVISLTLSNEDKTRGQIQLFLLLCHIEKFTRLQSLTLIQINDIHLNRFLNYIITSSSSLKFLSISLQTFQVEKNLTTSNLLSTAITHHTLRNLYLNVGLKDWNDIQWINNNTLKYLRLINSITLKYLCIILSHSPCLETLVLQEISINSNEEEEEEEKDNIHVGSFKQLKSLTFEDGRIQISKLNQCLSLTPCLIYLKLIGNGTLFDSSFHGDQLEKILQIKLPLLKNFEFFFCILTYSNYRSHNIENLIDSYRTIFWLKKLHCFITCDYIANSRKIMLYTLPICHTHFVYHIDAKKISLSNFTNRINNNNNNDMDYVKNLELNLSKNMKILSNEQIESSKNFLLFRNVNNLKLGNDGEWPRYSLEFLSTIIDLSHIIKLSLSINFISENILNIISNINLLFNQTSNLHSLLLYDYWTPDICMKRMNIICSIITSNIKHLQIRVKDLNDIKYILERLEHLTSITFEYAQMLTINRQEFIQSLTYLNRYVSIWDSQSILHVWLEKKKE